MDPKITQGTERKKNHIPYFGAISSLLLFVASIRPIFCIFKTVFCTYICFSPLSMLICPPLYQITDHQNRFKEKVLFVYIHFDGV